MLQQTQVERVIPFYKSFLKEFPTVRSLAQSSLARVLRVWQGLGYNRRAKYLHETAKQILVLHTGTVPRGYADLRALPGVGEYTARAIRSFAWSEPELLIETNIRTIFLHHFFSQAKSVADSQLVPYMELCLDRRNPREWYFALMDYGAHLKKTIGNASQRSAHHVRQKPFKGSNREIRGAILRALSKKSQSLKNLLELPFSKKRIQAQLQKLLREGLIALHASRYALHA
ncbi:MAG TPA: A/G-specific adenine glycosylase [Candidatus Paceibacterota bacterium]